MTAKTETVGQRIRKFREERGLTPSALADKAGVARSYLSALENDESAVNHRRPSADTLYRLAEVLGVAMSDLLGKPIITQKASTRPKSLIAFAKSRNLPEADIEMLAGIRFRGDEPQSPERWEFIYQAIKNSAPMDQAPRSRS
jgi:transcriptional regulator with XRE-family HTH domain